MIKLKLQNFTKGFCEQNLYFSGLELHPNRAGFCLCAQVQFIPKVFPFQSYAYIQ